MKISSEALVATIRGAVAEQRAAALAFDAGRLATANVRLQEALTIAQSSTDQPGMTADMANSLHRELSANQAMLQTAQAANQRALETLMPGSSAAPVYGADGATKPIANGKAIGLA